jgi:hypothetical protein
MRYEKEEITMKQVKRPDGITIIAIIELVLAAPFFLGALAILFFAVPAVLMYARHPMGLLAPLFGLAIGILFSAAFGVLLTIAGIGMLSMRNWARIMTIILAIVMLPGFPVGTLLGVAALWYLFQDEVKALFDEDSRIETSAPGQED